MARAAALRRDDIWEAAGHPMSDVSVRREPVLIAAAAHAAVDPGASPDLAAIEAAILLCARRTDLALDAPAPTLTVPACDSVSIDVPPVETGYREPTCPVSPRARRITLGLVASLVLHVGAAAAALYLGLASPAATSATDDSVAVEIVAGEPGAAALQDQASGREEASAVNASAEQRNVEAPPVETPTPQEADPTALAGDQPPVAQPDPVTSAQTVLDVPPPPPTPETLAITAEPVPPPVEAVQDTPPPPQPDPERQVETAEPSPVLAMVAPRQEIVPAVQPVTPPRQQARPAIVTPPVQARRPPTRREAPTTRESVRPTRQVAALAATERANRREAAPARAASAPRGEGTGQQNSQASNGQGAAGGAASASAVATWRAQVLAHLARFKVYPDQARERGVTGRAAIAFTLSRGGQVTASSLAGSSGAAILDQATIAMLRRAQPFPPMPAGGPASMSFTAGITYSLR